MFWGERYGSLTDPFGHVWSISTPSETLTTDEIAARAHAMFDQRQPA